LIIAAVHIDRIEALNATKLIAVSLLNERIQRVLTIVRRYRSSVVARENDNLTARRKSSAKETIHVACAVQ
jgi:hypothetical protein